jgi:hypothetical protein
VKASNFIESIAATLADGIVEESELKVTVPKLEKVIQECASLKYLSEDLCEKEKKKAKYRTLDVQIRLAGVTALRRPARRYPGR